VFRFLNIKLFLNIKTIYTLYNVTNVTLVSNEHIKEKTYKITILIIVIFIVQFSIKLILSLCRVSYLTIFVKKSNYSSTTQPKNTQCRKNKKTVISDNTHRPLLLVNYLHKKCPNSTIYFSLLKTCLKQVSATRFWAGFRIFSHRLQRIRRQKKSETYFSCLVLYY